MRHLRVVRPRGLTTHEQITAIFRLPALYELAEVLPGRHPSGRPANHPGYLLLAYGVLARVFRSGIRVEAELAQPAVWAHIVATVADMAAARPDLDIPPPGPRSPGWDAYRYARNKHLTDPETLADLQHAFTALAVEQAQGMGLLNPSGAGSLCHPDRSRTVYGDGTVVRPLYRPPTATRSTDPATGVTTISYKAADGTMTTAPPRRHDPDVAVHHGHTGPVQGQNFVAFYVRGDAPHQRVVLAVDRVPAPGQEAETAVGIVGKLHEAVGSGLQAVVYDGAFRGRHLDQLMTECGVVVVNKVHASGKTAVRRGKTGAAAGPRWLALGTWEHGDDAGPCRHLLAAVDGAVCETGLDEEGKPTVLQRLVRRQVKRPRRTSGRYHFNVGYEVPCDRGSFLAWVTPHAQPGDRDARRADAVRVIAEGEPDFDRLYGLRNDAESFNSQLKRTLLVDRAMSLGGRRQLLDVLCFGLLNNAVTAHHAALALAPEVQGGRRLRAA